MPTYWPQKSTPCIDHNIEVRIDCRGKRSGSTHNRNTEPQSSHGQPDSRHDQKDIRGQIKEQSCSKSLVRPHLLCTGMEAVPATRHKQHRRSTAKDDKDYDRGGRGGV